MAQRLGPGVRGLAGVVALLTGLTGLTMFGLPELAGGTLWPWLLTPLVSRYLGALFIGVAVGTVLVARAHTWEEVRLLFPPALTFTGLSLVAAALHTASFNPARLATWLFIALYALVFAAGLVTFLRYERGR
jgi:hypothetical protein